MAMDCVCAIITSHNMQHIRSFSCMNDRILFEESLECMGTFSQIYLRFLWNALFMAKTLTQFWQSLAQNCKKWHNMHALQCQTMFCCMGNHPSHYRMAMQAMANSYGHLSNWAAGFQGINGCGPPLRTNSLIENEILFQTEMARQDCSCCMTGQVINNLIH